ncbi:MAG: lipid asymmetry maintenance ABC transporter permease subunit MlaE [Gammaproteobacteria bacterium]|nr:lipid asymmetry maintenance ABC transporter permease subunit MlaE [Gammaproteobacteria bacterium]
MMNVIRILGRKSLHSFGRLGRGFIFLLQILTGIPQLFKRPRLIVQQLYSVGVMSMTIIVVSGLFTGMVLGLQLFNTMQDFGAEQSVGSVTALSLVRELGPVLTAIFFAGLAGTSLTAEIGLMKTTEQLSGMEMMAVDPVHRVIAPRFLAGFISVPVLALMFSAVAIQGGYFVSVSLLGLDSSVYWGQMQNIVDWDDDILNGVIKSVVFGFVAAWIAVFEGYDAVPTSEGVSRATIRTVVHTSLSVLGLDFIMTALMFGD